MGVGTSRYKRTRDLNAYNRLVALDHRQYVVGSTMVEITPQSILERAKSAFVPLNAPVTGFAGVNTRYQPENRVEGRLSGFYVNLATGERQPIVTADNGMSYIVERIECRALAIIEPVAELPKPESKVLRLPITLRNDNVIYLPATVAGDTEKVA